MPFGELGRCSVHCLKGQGRANTDMPAEAIGSLLNGLLFGVDFQPKELCYAAVLEADADTENGSVRKRREGRSVGRRDKDDSTSRFPECKFDLLVWLVDNRYALNFDHVMAARNPSNNRLTRG